MRYAGSIAAVVLLLGCGPDPNAVLPGASPQVTPSGGSGPAGTGGTLGSGGAGPGGTTSSPPQSSGGTTGTSPFGSGGTKSTGGVPSSGGSIGSGGVTGTGGRSTTTIGRGGATSSGGATGRGGATGTTTTARGGTSGGNGGTTGTTTTTGGRDGSVDAPGGTGGARGIDAGGGTSTAACANATPISGSVTFQTTGTFCFVTCDNTTNGWGCDSFTDKDRTVTVNGTKVTCGGAMPAKNGGEYYYFEIGAGGNTWDAIHFSGPPVSSCPAPAGGFSP
jgi:hypothetical protein